MLKGSILPESTLDVDKCSDEFVRILVDKVGIALILHQILHLSYIVLEFNLKKTESIRCTCTVALDYIKL